MASSPTDSRLLLRSLSARKADKIPSPGDASPVQRVEIMVRKARDINVAVEFIHAPAFVYKVESDTPCRSSCWSAARLRERYRHARAFSCASMPSITGMHAALPRFFAPDADDSRVIRTRRVVELVDPQGESAIFQAAQE
jgi:hypothetical protein